jgi:hypothetical protein
MKNKYVHWIVRRLIDFCCGQALKQQQRADMLRDLEGIKYMYSIGSCIVQRDKWLKRIDLLEKSIDRD